MEQASWCEKSTKSRITHINAKLDLHTKRDTWNSLRLLMNFIEWMNIFFGAVYKHLSFSNATLAGTGPLWIAIISGKDCSMDVNECSEGIDECVENSSCYNTIGNYECICNDGYRGDGKKKCYEIILLPYGPDHDTLLWPVSYGVVSPSIRYVKDIWNFENAHRVSCHVFRKICEWKNKWTKQNF